MKGVLFDGEIARGRKVNLSIDLDRGVLFLQDGEGFETQWMLADIRAVADQVGREKSVFKLGNARLVSSEAELLAELSAHNPDLHKTSRKPGQLRRALIWAGAALGAVAVLLFVILPALSDRLAVFIPPEREEALGKSTVENLRWALARAGGRDVKFCSNPKGRAALFKLARRLERDDGMPYPVKLQVIDHPMENAFAVPGGHVVLFEGLIKKAPVPEVVASVLAHEFGHVVARDPTRLALRSASSAGILGLLIGDVTGGAAALLLTEQLLSARYTRDAERAADEYAHKVLAEAGLPLEPMAQFFEKMQRGSSAPDGGLLAHLQSHPDLDARAAAAREADRVGEGAYSPVLTPEEWLDLRQICATTLEEPVP